jgi:hypothetical protein
MPFAVMPARYVMWALLALVAVVALLAVGVRLRSAVERIVSKRWFGNAAWLVGLVVCAAILVAAVEAAPSHKKADKSITDVKFWSLGIAAFALLSGGTLLFTAGRQRYTALEDFSWQQPESSGVYKVAKDEKLAAALYEKLPKDKQALVAQVLVASQDLDYTDTDTERSLKRGDPVPVGAEELNGVKGHTQPTYTATKAFKYVPVVTKTVKRGETVSDTDSARPEAVGRVARNRGISFRSLYVGKDGRWSTSKLTPLLWTGVVAYAMVALFVASELLHVQLFSPDGGDAGSLPDPTAFGDLRLPDEYFLLLGGPFAAAILAKAITANKVSTGELTSSTRSTSCSICSPWGSSRSRLSAPSTKVCRRCLKCYSGSPAPPRWPTWPRRRPTAR